MQNVESDLCSGNQNEHCIKFRDEELQSHDVIILILILSLFHVADTWSR